MGEQPQPSPDLIARLAASLEEMREVTAAMLRVLAATPEPGDIFSAWVAETERLGIPPGFGVRADAALALLRAAPAKGCINCGEANDGGYEIEEVGSFCEQCWRFLGEYFARNPLDGVSTPAPPAPTEEQAIVVAARAYAAAEGRWQEALNAWHDGPIPQAIKDAREAQAAAQANLLAAVGSLPPPTETR